MLDTGRVAYYVTNMTTKQLAKLTALRDEAEMHDDAATVALVDAAMSGDVGAAAKLGIAAKAHRAVSTGASARAPKASRPSYAPRADHPWSEDVE